jgi:hypothetical protein
VLVGVLDGARKRGRPEAGDLQRQLVRVKCLKVMMNGVRAHVVRLGGAKE